MDTATIMELPQLVGALSGSERLETVKGSESVSLSAVKKKPDASRAFRMVIRIAFTG
jgi:hypothetical protein